LSRACCGSSQSNPRPPASSRHARARAHLAGGTSEPVDRFVAPAGDWGRRFYAFPATSASIDSVSLRAVEPSQSSRISPQPTPTIQLQEEARATTPSNEEIQKSGPVLRGDSPPQFTTPPWQQDVEKLSAALHQAINSRGTARNRVTHAHLQEVAEVYRRAIAEGIPPKKAVSAELRASISTAGRWISLARQQGILGRTLPGKKGELDDPHTVNPEDETA
jgi:hypothetical protein